MLDTAWPAWPQGLSSRHGSSIVRGLIQSLGERFPGPQATLLQVFEEIADRLSLAVPQQRFSRARTLHPRTTTASSPARRLSRTPGGPHRIATTTLAKSKLKSRDFLSTALPPWPAWPEHELSAEYELRPRAACAFIHWVCMLSLHSIAK